MNVREHNFNSTVVLAEDYKEKQPKMKNLYYYYIKSMVDTCNQKISNGIIVYELLKMNGVGDYNDPYDDIEENLNMKLIEEGLSRKDIERIDNYEYYDNVKSRLETNIENYYPHVSKTNKYGKKIRLPKSYFESCEKLQGRGISKVIYNCIEFHIKHPFDSRDHRMKFKRKLLKKFESSMTANFTDVEKELINDVLDTDVSGISDEYIVNNIKTQDQYINNSDKLTRWGDRMTALQNVVDNSDIEKSEVKDLIRDAHNISIYSDVENKIDKLYDDKHSENVNEDIIDFLEMCDTIEQFDKIIDIHDPEKDKSSAIGSCCTVLRNNNVSKFKQKNYDWSINKDTVEVVLDKIQNSNLELKYETAKGLEMITDHRIDSREDIELNTDKMVYEFN